MEKRIQRINGDVVLEITSQEAVKTRLSTNDLLRRRAYLEESIAKFQADLDETDADLADIHAEEIKA